ncbi:SDR family NAD(P)-dependent oxidoreductase [Cerasicoccus arenae]|uniref:Dehydrogenase n=1 Tax=Cerasicoccus arenae TaxID=424488 RepID=A0A8J3DCJ3_9BACT|nr:SDR family NAD(P)-dependent oxidoreductase [Cerasicoccus arenae]MBK1859553.1 SDR family NAD(P)-dependent oxidoreductase [Cerasicoccus arenae]GHC03171.1 dehydrogenase [Cerasicoccus arenae]
MNNDSLSRAVQKYTAVIVTGGSSGIGRGLIAAISKLNPSAKICNISRSEPQFNLPDGVLTHIAGDLSQASAVADVGTKVINWLKLNGGAGEVLLVNNSGVGAYGFSQDIELDKQLAVIDLNVRAVVQLTGIVLPQLLERGGTVMTISSTASFQPTPVLSVYGATKSFVFNWSLALGNDLKGTKVNTIVICPGPTDTGFFEAAGFTGKPPGVVKTEQVIDTCLEAIAKQKKHDICGFMNKLMCFFSQHLPRTFLTNEAGKLMRKIRHPDRK